MWLLVPVALASPQWTVAPAKEAYTLGEPLWIDLTVVNGDAEPLQLCVRDEVQIDVAGALDPRHVPENPMATGCSEGRLAQGESLTMRYDVAREAWLQPGTHDVRVTWAVGPQGPVLQGATRLVIREVTDPAKVLDTLPASVAAQGDHDVADGWTRWESLGHPVYVPLLEARMRDHPEERALHGLAACPCTEATEALLRLAAAVEEPWRTAIAEELLARSTKYPPFSVDPAFRQRAWSEAHEAQLLELARSFLDLERPYDSRIEFAVQTVGRLGDASDAPRLLRAMELTLEASPTGTQGLWVVLRALAALQRASDPATHDVRVRSVLDLLEPHPEGAVERLLASGDPLLEKVGCEYALTREIQVDVRVAARLVGARDAWVDQRVGRLLHPPRPEVRDALRAELQTASGPRADALRRMLEDQPTAP